VFKICSEITISLYTRPSWLVNDAVLDRGTYIASQTRYSTMGGNACLNEAGADRMTHA
jgi:hypothetical protein